MHPVFYFIFALTIIYEEIRKRQGFLLMQLISSMRKNSDKSPSDGLSVASRSASRTILMKYKHGDSEYEMVIPMARKKRLAWNTCIAHFENGTTKEVTDAVVYRAGPFGDFFGMTEKLKPFQIVTGSNYLEFFNSGRLIMAIGHKREISSASAEDSPPPLQPPAMSSLEESQERQELTESQGNDGMEELADSTESMGSMEPVVSAEPPIRKGNQVIF